MLISLGDERVHMLLERKLHADANGSPCGIWVRPFRTFIGGRHHPWTATRDDVTSLPGQFLGHVAYRSDLA
jgi:hypothetical protein